MVPRIITLKLWKVLARRLNIRRAFSRAYTHGYLTSENIQYSGKNVSAREVQICAIKLGTNSGDFGTYECAAHLLQRVTNALRLASE
jgi:hypothetical protein